MSFNIKEKPKISSSYTITVHSDCILIKHNKLNKACSIDIKTFKISENIDYNEILNKKTYRVLSAQAIIGILNYNKNKYLILVSQSKISAIIKESYVFRIDDVQLYKINILEQSTPEKEWIEQIKNFLKTKNFYYSLDYDLSRDLYMQDNKINDSNYLINLLLLEDFFIYKISKCFYCFIIFGYVGCKRDVDIKYMPNEKKLMDLIIIERTHKKSLRFLGDKPQQLRQIEFISVFKSPLKEDCIFSTVFYLANEIFYKEIKTQFNPYNEFIRKELNYYEKIICIINDINVDINESTLDSIRNNNELKDKLELINLVKKDWKQGLYFESNEHCDQYITNYFHNLRIPQKKVFWLIDINNSMINPQLMNDKFYNAIIRILWIAIQKQMNSLEWIINIGLFSPDNKTNLSKKYEELIIKYHDENEKNKSKLCNPSKINLVQNLYDFCFIGKIYNQNNNNQSNIQNNNNYNIISNFNNKSLSLSNLYKDKTNIPKKLNALCITWNVNDLQIENINNELSSLFTQNPLYKDNKYPDVIIISLQKLVKIKSNIEEQKIQSFHKKRDLWINKIKNYITKVYSNNIYIPLKHIDILGTVFISFIKHEYRDKMYIIDVTIQKNDERCPDIKLKDKGFITLTIKYYNNYISFASAYLNSGMKNNKYRFLNLKQILNTTINLNYNEKIEFKESNYWIILGDLNFREELDFNSAMELIKKNDQNYLLKSDQFYKYKTTDSDFNYINEGNIRFNPTYKFIKNSNEYNKAKIPSYTDRIFYGNKNGIKIITYDCINNLNLSDHKPVYGIFDMNF